MRTSLLKIGASCVLTGLVLSCSKDNVVNPPGADPRLTWEAHGIRNYSIAQERICFCGGPHQWTAVIEERAVARVMLETDFPEEAEIALNLALTVDEAFDLAERAARDADWFEVEYDPIYGFPTRIAIDWNKSMADEEMYWAFSDLETP